MNIFKTKEIAILITILVIVLASMYGLSKRTMTKEQTADSNSYDESAIVEPDLEPLGKSDVSEEPDTDEIFELGQSYYNAGDFKNAIEKLKQVSNDSPSAIAAEALLLEASEKYRTEILETADTYAAKQDYKTAIGIINEALVVIQGDQVLISTVDEYRISIRTYALEKADICVAEGDYVGAISAVERAIADTGEDEELKVLHNKYISDYKDLLILKAGEAYHATGYEDAVTILKQGLQVIGIDAEINELISKYEACTPISFYELSRYGSGYYYDGDPQGNYFFDDQVYDIEKIQHNNVICCLGDYWGTNSDGRTTRLKIDKEFKKISGTLFFRLESNDDTFHKASIRISGDGTVLYNKSVSNTDAAKYFEVDISDVVYLEVNIFTGFTSLSGNTCLFGGISDLSLFKEVM